VIQAQCRAHVQRHWGDQVFCGSDVEDIRGGRGVIRYSDKCVGILTGIVRFGS